MALIVPRRAKQARAEGDCVEGWLSDWRDEPAYVLLGDPGAGKSLSLRAEAEAVGGRLIPADLIQEGLAPDASSDEILFIDAVDEVRGTGNRGTDVLGAIGRYLLASGRPKFRLACREADWRGEADRRLIASLVPEGDVSVLHLEPLRDVDIEAMVADRSDLISDPSEFLDAAERHGVYELLRNPLLLDLMLNAVAEKGRWPQTRTEAYEAACRRLVEEASEAHRHATALQLGLAETILADAGVLCALLILSGRSAINLKASSASDALCLNALPAELTLTDPARALKSKVFTVEGEVARPRHRTIAEYLAARALAKRIADGLPLSRVLAVVQGHDGVPVEAMRGLCAWLTVHLSSANRQRLLTLDPLGFIVNGDAAALQLAERVLVLEALSASATQNRWFRSEAWVDHPFGPLATRDMLETYERELQNPDRSPGRQGFVDCLLDALKHAPEPLSALCGLLVSWVEDSTANSGVRAGAYEAWRRHCDPEERDRQLRGWLTALERASLEDADDRLLDLVLHDAYPRLVGADVVHFLRPKRTSREIAEFSGFWDRDFVSQTPVELLPALADAWVDKFPNHMPEGWGVLGERPALRLLAALLEAHGDTASEEKLYSWLGIGLEEHAASTPNGPQAEEVAAWLKARPNVMKAVAAFGYRVLRPDQHGHRWFWESDIRLYGAEKPRDWMRWLMRLAQESADPDFQQWVLFDAARLAVQPAALFDCPNADEVYQWVTQLAKSCPNSEQWLEDAWSLPLDHWSAKRHRNELHAKQERKRLLEERGNGSGPLLANWPAEPLPDRMLYAIAGAFSGRFYDVVGETPEERVAYVLGGNPKNAEKALIAIEQTLARGDLPTCDDILALERRGREHYVRPVALLAAARVYERTPEAWRSWSNEARGKLTAFWLTYGCGNEPAWFKALSAEVPEVVAPILVRYASGKLRRSGSQAITGLWALTHDDARVRLAQRVLPDLLATFPNRSHKEACHELNRSLLSGLHLLPRESAIFIVRRKLATSNLDTRQRIAWMVALQAYDHLATDELVNMVGRNPGRAAMLGHALEEQGILGRGGDAMTAAQLRQLIEMLAPFTQYDPDWPGGWVSPEKQREHLVKALWRALGCRPAEEAGSALRALLANESLGNWRVVAEFELQAHVRLYREATFTSTSLDDVAALLRNGPPANVADLLALVSEHIRGVEAELRGDPSFQLSQFWRDDGEPRGEEHCRDVLLAMLRPRLERQGIDLQPESLAAASKRMDMRATVCSPSARRFSLPVEAKKDDHRELWTAWQTQLQFLYSIDPNSFGFGLYLVFWFGKGCTASPEGDRPTAAAEIEERLQARVPEADRHKLRVVVLDLSWPTSAARRRR